MRLRIPEGDNWEDHATACPNCGKPVMREREHFNAADWVDPGWWSCDPLEPEEEEALRHDR